MSNRHNWETSVKAHSTYLLQQSNKARIKLNIKLMYTRIGKPFAIESLPLIIVCIIQHTRRVHQLFSIVFDGHQLSLTVKYIIRTKFIANYHLLLLLLMMDLQFTSNCKSTHYGWIGLIWFDSFISLSFQSCSNIVQVFRQNMFLPIPFLT